MSTIEQLQDWYRIHCDNDWEHDDRIEIHNLDNPGWLVKIDVSSTLLEDEEFIPIRYGDPEQRENDWIDCSIKDNIYIGMGSCNMLEKIISVFLQWSNDKTDTSKWDQTVEDLLQQIERCCQSPKEEAIEHLRRIYRQIDIDIPAEHPQKARLLREFYDVWNKYIL